MSQTRDFVLRIVALFCIASVVVAILLAHRQPATGYELSIYADTPSPVLWLLFMSVAGGVGIVVHELLTSMCEQRRTYLAGFAVILLGTITFLCLPLIRGYVAPTGADLFGHTGYVVDILRTGHLGSNVYPVTHTLLAEIALMTDISALEVMNLNTALVFVVFTLMVYLLATAVLPTKGHRLLAALVAGGTMAGVSRYYLVPNTWSILMLPLFFYCYFKQERISFRIVTVILLVLYPFFHPLSSFVIMVALSAMELPKPIYSRLLKHLGMGVPSWIESGPTLWPIVLEAAVFLPWVLTRPEFTQNVQGFWYGLINFSGSHGVQEAGTNLAKANVHGLGIAVLLFKMYGELLIFLILAALAAILLIKQIRFGIRDSSKYRLLLFGVWVPIILLFFLGNFLGLPALRLLGADRMILYIEVACIPLAAFALWEIAGRKKASYMSKVGAYGLITLALALNFCGHFASPYVVRPSEHVTQRDMAGMTWYLDEKDPQVQAWYVMIPPERFSQVTVGVKTTDLTRTDVYAQWQLTTHFGYDNYSTIREQYPADIYVNINRFDRVAYQTVWKSLDRFNDADFEMLELDPTVDRIYSNGEMDVLFVSQRSGA